MKYTSNSYILKEFLKLFGLAVIIAGIFTESLPKSIGGFLLLVALNGPFEFVHYHDGKEK